MLYIVLTIILIVIAVLVYFTVLKPYLAIQKIKKQFQSKGYKVLVEKLDFNDDTITACVLHDAEVHKDSMHRYKTTWKDYDVTIKNSYFAIYVSLNSLELVKQGYKKIQFLQKPWMMRNNFSRFYGGGLIMKGGEQWKASRKLYSEIFNFKLLEQLHSVIEMSVTKSLDQWMEQQNSKNSEQVEIDILNKARTMFFHSFLQCYFGRQFPQFSYQNKSYSQNIAMAFEDIIIQSFSFRHMVFGTKFLQRGFFKVDKQIQQRVHVLKTATKQFVEMRFEEIQKSGKENPQKRTSILSNLVFNSQTRSLKSQQKKSAIQTITGDLMLFFFAGTDTTGAIFSATLHMLHKHPQVKQKLLKQLSQSDETYNNQTLKTWKYMDAVLNQILRLYGPLNWIFVRQILDDQMTIGGVKLSKDIILGLQTHSIHCTEKYYEKPNQFMPERFLQDRRNDDPYTFVSFGGGQRNCIGQYLAKIEYKIALAKFIRKFQFSTQDQFVMHAPSIYVSKNNTFKVRRRNPSKLN